MKSSCPGENMFRCADSGFCIPKVRVCDGNDDCSIGDTEDTSDEKNCCKLLSAFYLYDDTMAIFLFIFWSFLNITVYNTMLCS